MQEGTSFALGHLSDVELVSSLMRVTCSHRRATAWLVAHLAEMDARKLYAAHATPSLFAYCVERLGFSEDEACRRIEAARIARKFPSVLERIETGEITLSVLGKLKAHLTQENAGKLLASVAGKSVRETERVLAARFPQPDVPESIRKVPEKKRPGALSESSVAATPPEDPAMGSRDRGESAAVGGRNSMAPDTNPGGPVEPVVDRGRLQPLSAERVLVKFTASRELERKLEQARDLMSHRNPTGDLASVIEAALDLLIAERLKKRFGQTAQPQKKRRPAKRTHVSNATRREVTDRDGLQCSFVDEQGRRCSGRGFLELDHRKPKGKGGSSETADVRVLCRTHNQMEAVRVYGKEHIERRKEEKQDPKPTRARTQRDLNVRDSCSARDVAGAFVVGCGSSSLRREERAGPIPTMGRTHSSFQTPLESGPRQLSRQR